MQAQRIDKDDVRFDIFTQMFDIIDDNIEVRVQNNRLMQGIIELNRTKVSSVMMGMIQSSKSTVGGNNKATPGGGKSTPGAQSLNDTIVMRKDKSNNVTPSGMTPGEAIGSSDFEKRKLQRSIRTQ